MHRHRAVNSPFMRSTHSRVGPSIANHLILFAMIHGLIVGQPNQFQFLRKPAEHRFRLGQDVLEMLRIGSR